LDIQFFNLPNFKFADSFTLWRARSRDRQLVAIRRQLIKFQQAFQKLESKTSIDVEARQRFEEVRQRLTMRYLRLKKMQKMGVLPRAPTQVPRCFNMTVYEDEDVDEPETSVSFSYVLNPHHFCFSDSTRSRFDHF
jgi:hypothetical protein